MKETFVPTSFRLAGAFKNSKNFTEMVVSTKLNNPDSWDPKLHDGEPTSNNYPDVTATLSFTANLAEVAPASVVLTGDLNGIFQNASDTEEIIPDAVVTLMLSRDNVQVFKVQAHTAVSGGTLNISTTVTDSTGASLVFSHTDHAKDTDEGLVFVDGSQIGSIAGADAGPVIIRYSDGTFETLL